MPDLRLPSVTNNPSKVQLKRIAHAYFEHPDLESFVSFADDFGLIEAKSGEDKVYYRGYGIDPYVYVASKSTDGKPHFNGAAFVAESAEEFAKAEKISGASVRVLDDAPGGGKMITFNRPNGTAFHVVYGQEERTVNAQQPPSATHELQGPYNTPFEKQRLGQFQRYHTGPALVHKLGHFGYACKEFDDEFDFYTSNFNFVPSDVLFDPRSNEVDVLTFLHLDRGKEFTDHHSLFLARAQPDAPRTYIHHSSYEVADFDTQLIGHDWLAKKDRKSVWGVGRHILGSQIFDYWLDTSGFKIEHYADGDVVNVDIPTKRDVAGALSVWGPEFPKEFMGDSTELDGLGFG